MYAPQVVGFKYLGLYWSECSLSPRDEAEYIPYSTIARFVIGTLVFGIIGIIQVKANGRSLELVTYLAQIK
jgi:hypothetical protein